MKKTALTFLLSPAWSLGFSQNRAQTIDSLKHELAIAMSDTSRVLEITGLALIYQSYKPDSSLYYAQNLLASDCFLMDKTDSAQYYAHDLAQNQEKINHHGKRAAAIVTGMLQHARIRHPADKKEPTDLNALADEYLRLSYHGLRAKDSTFNAKMETDFDPNLGKVEVIPQDMGGRGRATYKSASETTAPASPTR